MEGPLPTRIGRYEVRSELGRGMMGVVYAALDPALGREVAVKTVRFAFALSTAERQAFERRFFTEARIAAQLSHPGIVVVHDAGRDAESGMLFIALERLQGRTLAEILKDQQRLGWRQAIEIVAGVAHGLHHAHCQGVIHRDVKPANVMILPSGQPKIMDFGIAHLETNRAKLTAPGEFLGTPLYMSPEQTLGGPLDARADVFSLGAITYAMVTGRLAFGGGTLTRIIDRVVHDDPPPPSELVADLPAGVDRVVARALAQSPADRYHDARALAEDAEDLLAGRPPRHASAWRGPASSRQAPRGAEDPLLEAAFQEPTRTLVGVDIEAQLARLVAGAGSGRRTLPPPHVRLRWAAALAMALVAAGDHEVRGGATLHVVEHLPLPAPQVSARVAPAVPASVSTSARTDSTPLARVEPGPAAEPRRAVRPGRLEVDFQHPLKSGTLRLWIDGRLVLEEQVKGEARKVLGVKLYRGSLEKQLEVTPRAHRILVQVAWDDETKDARLAAHFAPGASRRLEIRLRRLPRDLSLQLS